MDFNKTTMKKIILIVFSAIAFYCLLQNVSVMIRGFHRIVDVFFPFLIGASMAFILNIPMRNIEKRLFPSNQKLNPVRRPLAFLITLVLLIGILVLVAFVVIPQLVRTFLMLADQVPDALRSLEAYLYDLSIDWPQIQLYINELDIDWQGISKKAVTLLQNTTTLLVNSGFNAVGKTVSSVATFVISLIFSIYLLMQKEALARQGKQVLYGLLPLHVADKTVEVLSMAQTTFSKFFSGQCLEAVILGTLFLVTMTLFKMPYALLVGVLIAVTALIPIVGAFIGCFVGAFLILIVNPVTALKFIVLFLVLQQIEGNVIYPKVVGNSVGLPSIWVLTAVTVGGNLFGVIGMLVFIPLCSVAYALFRTFIKDRLTKRQIPSDKWI
ncbi:MAG: AI-2E family transporter [Firmicutes bacterium]|nr:AI-2E family transporter [Bacillota bacterium]